MASPSLHFDYTFVDQLPADPEPGNFRRQVHNACYSRVTPTTVPEPTLASYSPEVAELIGLSPDYCESDQFAAVFAGNQLLDGMEPYAMCYGGHQFGHWAGQLGDGRAINLGEILNRNGERWALQLKGAGPTPYSRDADGLAVLRSSLREFLCSEAMYHLGVPTTRALSLVLTGKQVLRDMLYDGHPEYEQGAVVCRVAPSFIRFGNFQIHSSRGNLALLRQLIDYSIRVDFPYLIEQQGDISNSVIKAWFDKVCTLTAEMVVHWMRVGFVHGVMNTDNMSILGLTIDYGPYGWLEDYDPDWTPNTTDAQGKRYRFGNQAEVAHWNLVQLAQSIVHITDDVEHLQQALNRYAQTYQLGYQQMMNNKLGLPDSVTAADTQLAIELLDILQMTETDMTLFFRQLADPTIQRCQSSAEQIIATLQPTYYQFDDMTDQTRRATLSWIDRYQRRISDESGSPESRAEQMNACNPLYILRNYQAQLAIDDAEKGDFTAIHELLDVLRTPYTAQAGKERFAEKRPEWARHRVGCSMLSCSS